MTKTLKPVDTNYPRDEALSAAARSGRILAEQSTADAPLIGHVTIGIYGDGGYSIGYNMPTDHQFIGPTLFLAYIKEIIARDLTGKMSADDYAKEYLL